MMTEQQLTQWMDTYGTEIFRLCYLCLKDYHLAQDAAQETFIKAMSRYDSFRHQCSEKTWLTKIAVNICKNIQRTSWFRFGRDPLQENIPLQGDPYGEVLQRDRLSQAILKLRTEDRQILLLYYYQELSMQEIAQILGKRENTIVQRVYRARTRLKKILLEVDQDEELPERAN